VHLLGHIILCVKIRCEVCKVTVAWWIPWVASPLWSFLGAGRSGIGRLEFVLDVLLPVKFLDGTVFPPDIPFGSPFTKFQPQLQGPLLTFKSPHLYLPP
jgi:hypothetical protein